MKTQWLMLLSIPGFLLGILTNDPAEACNYMDVSKLVHCGGHYNGTCGVRDLATVEPCISSDSGCMETHTVDDVLVCGGCPNEQVEDIEVCGRGGCCCGSVLEPGGGS